MLFSRKNKDNIHLNIKVNNTIISQVEQAKFLGIIFDRKLRWNKHIAAIKKKSSKATNILKAFAGVKWGAHPNYIINIYKGYVRAILEWGFSYYGNACQTTLNKLEPVQNSAIKICLGLLKGTPTFNALKAANIPPLKSRRQLLMDQYILKVAINKKHQLNPKLQLLNESIKRRTIKGKGIMEFV